TGSYSRANATTAIARRSRTPIPRVATSASRSASRSGSARCPSTSSGSASIRARRRCGCPAKTRAPTTSAPTGAFPRGYSDLARDVLRAVHVPRRDGQDELIAFELGAAPDLHAPAVVVVHEDHAHAIVLAQVADRDVLAIAGKLGERERVIVDGADKAGRTT